MHCGTITRFVDLLGKGWECHHEVSERENVMTAIGCRPKMLCPKCGANLWEQNAPKNQEATVKVPKKALEEYEEARKRGYDGSLDDFINEMVEAYTVNMK